MMKRRTYVESLSRRSSITYLSLMNERIAATISIENTKKQTAAGRKLDLNGVKGR